MMHRVHDRVITKKKDEQQRALKAAAKIKSHHGPPSFMLEHADMLKYWHNRFELFSRFDDGIRLDRESWFSVTPERVAKYQARRLACEVIVDGFCGSGGNAIQFAMTCGRVIAIDIDPAKVEMAKHNASIYGVADRIEFRVGDFLRMCGDGSLPRSTNCVFLSPPWGGPTYNQCGLYDIERLLQPVGASVLMQETRRISTHIALYLPRNSDLEQIVRLTGSASEPCEVHHNFLGNRMVAITAFYGNRLVDRDSEHLYFDNKPSTGAHAASISHSRHLLNNCPLPNTPILNSSSLNENLPLNSSATSNDSAPKYSNNWQNYSSSNKLSLSPRGSNFNVSSVLDDILNTCTQCSLM